MKVYDVEKVTVWVWKYGCQKGIDPMVVGDVEVIAACEEYQSIAGTKTV